jgi:hypothetical protein
VALGKWLGQNKGRPANGLLFMAWSLDHLRPPAPQPPPAQPPPEEDDPIGTIAPAVVEDQEREQRIADTRQGTRCALARKPTRSPGFNNPAGKAKYSGICRSKFRPRAVRCVAAVAATSNFARRSASVTSPIKSSSLANYVSRLSVD